MIIKPQPVQERFLSSSADVLVFGSGAGIGKTFALLVDHLRWVNIPEFRGLIVRKSYAQIFSAGGLWDEAKKIYTKFGAVGIKTPNPRFVFPSGAEVIFKHSNREAEVEENFQGVQADLISIDEAATGFSLREFLYISSRLRSMTNIDSYIRLTCNPNPNSFIYKMVKWYLKDDNTPDFNKSGIVRYYIMENNDFIWADTKQELKDKYGRDAVSFTFMPAVLDDNQALLKKEPNYRQKLENLSSQDVEALLKGSWAVVDNPLALFRQADINKNRIDRYDHTQAKRIVIAIDPAGTHNKNSDDTGIIVAALDHNNKCYVLQDETGKYTPEDWAKMAIELYDYYEADCIIAEKNYGGDMVEHTIRSQARLMGRSDIKPKLVNATRGKAVRAEPVSLLYASGDVVHVGCNLVYLEKELTSWVPHDPSMKSPNRLDAVVWAVTDLLVIKQRERRAFVA